MRMALLVLGMLLVLQGSAAAQGSEQPVELEAGYELNTLTKGLPSWTEFYLEGKKQLADRAVIYGTARHTRRFALDDNELALGGYVPLDAKWTANLEASLSTGRVLAKWSGAAALHRNLGAGWGIEAGYRHRLYAMSGVDSERLTVEKYFSSFRAAYTFTMSQGVAPTTAHALALSHYYGQRSRITLGLAVGDEVESLGNGVLLRSNVRYAGIYGLHEVAPDWSLTYALGINDQQPLYTRRQIRFGVRHAF